MMDDKNHDKEITLFEMMARALSGEESSDAIVNQEARGQKQFVNSDVLPVECPRLELEQLGFVFGDMHDDIFIKVTMPQGWEKRASSHNMWSYLHDPQGRQRGAIFYKAAFYDRSAHMSLDRRFHYGAMPENGYESETYNTDNRKAYVKDMATGAYVFEITGIAPKDSKAEDAAKAQCKQWLLNNYPDYENVLAYWD
jgi:hypothetical protein